MSAPTLTQIWRYPIKGIGAERLESITVEVNRPLPLDRAWAVREAGGSLEPGWQSCRNFLRGAKGPGLMGVMARVEGTMLTLSHPAQTDLTVPMEEESAAALFDWLAPIYPADRNAPEALVKAPEEGMADVPFASVSLMNHSSRRALSQRAGQDLDARRFRGNLWVDGLAPWEEFDLLGKHIQLGSAEFKLLEPITRCRATEANPDTGQRDVNTLRVLETGWGHTDFGVNAVVTKPGMIRCTDKMVVL